MLPVRLTFTEDSALAEVGASHIGHMPGAPRISSPAGRAPALTRDHYA